MTDFTAKAWQNGRLGGTPLDASALVDMEERLAAHANARAPQGISIGGARGAFSLERLSDEPIIQGAATPLDQTLYWFCPMRVDDKLDDPLDTYYAWESTDHDRAEGGSAGQGGIFLRTAPDPVGPWSERTLLFQDTTYASETETPSVVYVPEDPNGRPFYCYYQESDGATQFTRMRSSADGRTGWVQETCRNLFGTNDTAGGNDKRLILSQASTDLTQVHTGYLNVFRLGSYFGGFSRVGGTQPEAFGRWHSWNGKDWALDPRLLRFSTRQTGAPAKWIAWTQFNPFQWRGRYYSLATIIEGLNRDPVIVPLGDDLRTIIGPPQTILTPEQAWETTTGVRHIRPFEDGGTLYVYVTYGDPGGGEGHTTGVYRLVGG